MAADVETSIILGGGYAGLAAWEAARRRSRGKWPILLVDRHPVHVLRTELYEVGRIAARQGAVSPWALPLRSVLGSAEDALVTGEIEAIDLESRTVRVAGGSIRFRELAICLGSVPSYYGVAGAREHTFNVYRLTEAQRLAEAIRLLESTSVARGAAPKIVVVGGGSTGTEVAAEIATSDWSRIVGHRCLPPQVTLIAGALPFLAGLPGGLVRHARALLLKARVNLDEGRNSTRVDPDGLELQGGTVVPFDLCVWAAGNEAPPLVRDLPVPHGRGGRVRVDEHLEIPGFPGVFAVGDVAEYTDATTHAVVPATAQAALAEAPVAGENLVARRLGRPLREFRYREKGVIVALGIRAGAGSVRGLTIWGRPAALVKSASEELHRAEVGRPRATRRRSLTHARLK
ncbi:MAG TPA: FAD-dependent oxidoreductase [Thermoplasmata archaeon]|nr:FAD-dependent oxidoreductase [Thermoplasmata archaeon]